MQAHGKNQLTVGIDAGSNPSMAKLIKNSSGVITKNPVVKGTLFFIRFVFRAGAFIRPVQLR